MNRSLVRMAALAAAALAACSSSNGGSSGTTTLIMTATPSSVVANGKNTVLLHVEGATKAPIVIRTTRGSFGGNPSAQVDALAGDFTLTTCDTSVDASCGGSFNIIATDADNNAGHASLKFGTLAGCPTNCALDAACAGVACTTTGGAAGTCSASPAACVPAVCTSTETTETSCMDGIDNDCNGLVDGADTACEGKQCKTDATWTWKSGACTQATTGFAISVVPARTRLPADGLATTTVLVTVKNGTGPASGVPVTLTASAGGVAPASKNTAADGTASFVFTAPATAALATLTATATPASGTPATLTTTITMPALGSLELGSMTYNVMGVKGSAYQEQNQLVVSALDDQGAPYPDGLLVKFDHVSTGGSALSLTLPPAGCTALTPCSIVSTPAASPLGKPDSAGLASVWLSSGTLAGPYQVVASATAGGVTRNITIPTLFAIGAKASGLDFGIDCSPRNVAALAETNCSTSFVDATITCLARIKDRFGNLLGREVPVLFRSEASGYGHVQTTPSFDPTAPAASQATLGSAVDIFRTHLDGLPKNVDPQAGEPFVLHALDGCSDPATPANHNPRDGVVTIIAIADGEESFVDVNGNGDYDGPASPALAGTTYFAAGEPFVDLGEPFIDANDNGAWDPGEWFYDVNGNGQHDGPDGKWNAQTKIWTQTVVVYTGFAAGELAAGGGKFLGTRWVDTGFAGACTPTLPASDFVVHANRAAVAAVVADPTATPPVVGVPAILAKPAETIPRVAVASDLNLNFLATSTTYAAAVDAPGKVSANYLGAKGYADLLGFQYRYWPCNGTTCANECYLPGACAMQPSVTNFSCGVAAGVNITGGSEPDGANTVEWMPFTTYPVYNGSHITTREWSLSGTNVAWP